MIWCDFDSDVRFRWVELNDMVIQVRATYIDEVWEKINTGRQRVKKRNRTVVQTQQVNVVNKVKGTFVELEMYKKDRFPTCPVMVVELNFSSIIRY